MHNSIDNFISSYLKSLTLLCVEDNETIQLLYKEIFENIFAEVILAYNGQEGFEKFQNHKVDMLLVDYNMPLINGIEMIQKVRPLDKEIPILLVSAIEDIDVIIQALELNVNNFLKKPIDLPEIVQAIEKSAKLLFAQKYLEEEKEKKFKEFEKKEQYSSYQEELAFLKQLNILRNDFYYQMHKNSATALIDFFYKPLDTLSGDAYSAREIDESNHLFFIVDGMGKGLSASLSAILLTTFVNHHIDKTKHNFSFATLIESALEYIKPILLDDEALAVDFIVMNYKGAVMHYAKFAMPSSLLESTSKEIIYIKSNNPPMSKYTKTFEISQREIKYITKFLFYSDGIVENSVRTQKTLYAEHLKADFLSSFTKDELREKILWKTDTQEDDMTFIFIHQLNDTSSFKKTKTFQSTLEAVDEANAWYTEVWQELTQEFKLIYHAGVVFNELFMNAYEHGNLGIDAVIKNELMAEDKYFTTLEEIQKECTKKITVEINAYKYEKRSYITTAITDEGNGFNTEILSTIFRNKKNFNGRGVYISRQSSLGLYYNSKGNSVLFLHKIEDEA